MMHEYRNFLLAAGKSAGTVKIRLSHLRQLQKVYPNLLTVEARDLEAYFASHRFDRAPETRKSQRASIRSFYRWATRVGRIERDPAADLPAIPVPRKIARIAPDEDVVSSLRGATLHERAMILLARLGALRLSEIASLHTDHRRGHSLVVTGKGNKQRVVPLNDDLYHVLAELERDNGGSGYYFPGRFGGYMHPQSVNKIITRRTGWNPHSLRHAAATAAWRRTHNLRAVQEFLGHASIATTELYLHTSFDEVREVADATALPSNVYPLRRPPGLRRAA